MRWGRGTYGRRRLRFRRRRWRQRMERTLRRLGQASGGVFRFLSLRRLLLGGAMALLLAVGGGYLWLRGGAAPMTGEIAVNGLTAPVTITRDTHGIPYIRAATLEDAFFAVGFVHAEDRLWQMDVLRRMGRGRLAEIFGPQTLPQDRLMITLGIADLAEANLSHLDEATRRALEAYSAGVNAWLVGHEGALPPEFYILGHRPAPWTAADSLLWGRLMAQRLAGNWREELQRAALARHLPARDIAALWPPYPADGPVTLAARMPSSPASPLPTAPDPQPKEDAAALPGDKAAMDTAIDVAGGTAGKGITARDLDAFFEGGASNSWVLEGRQSESGLPLLANDPHLGLTTPGPWYLLRIDTPELTLAGVTAPGVPFLILGHNGKIAWGFTTTHSDTQDLFIERLTRASSPAASSPQNYDTPNGSRAFTVSHHTIPVKDGKNISLRRRHSRHGPVISDVLPETAALLEVLHEKSVEADGIGDRFVLALADPGLREDDRTADALYALNHAGDWETFTAAMKHFHSPQQNVVYADRNGNIGFYAPARVPVRRNGNGALPAPGWESSHDWAGFIPMDALPHALNPPSGRLVSANNKIIPDDYHYQIAEHWPPPYRATRILELLDTEAAHDLASSEAIQMDVHSTMADDLLPHLLALESDDASRRRRPETRRKARALLKSWNRLMDRDHPAPLVFTAWLKALGPRLYGDETGAAFSLSPGVRPLFLKNTLRDKSHWCDNIDSAPAESCGEIVADALDAALADLSRRFGDDLRAWRWGMAHRASFAHPVLSRLPLIGGIWRHSVATDGGEETVNRGSALLNDGNTPFAHVHGAGVRAVYDLAHLDQSRFIIVPGEAGNPLSRHFSDLVTPWRDGAYLALTPPPGPPDLVLRPPSVP